MEPRCRVHPVSAQIDQERVQRHLTWSLMQGRNTPGRESRFKTREETDPLDERPDLRVWG